MTDRREYLLQSEAAVAGLGLTAAEAVAQAPADEWYARPMRWMQLAFVEDDPGQYDPAFWLDYFKRVHADAACLSAGGCVGFYPSRGPFYYKSKYVCPADRFGDMGFGWRKLG